MDHANAAADILPRSVWDSITTRVTVLATAGGYVRFRAANGSEKTLHHLVFRRIFTAIYDRRAVKSQFSMSCANLTEFKAYWMPVERKMVARSVGCTRKFRVPDGAIQIGVYTNPFSAEAFLDDLDCVLAALDTDATRRSAAA